MSRDLPAGPTGGVTNRMSGLVASLRTHRHEPEGHAVRRSANLEALLPEGHRARLIWDYVVGGAARDLPAIVHGETSPAGPTPQVLLALWIYAYSRGVGSAHDLVELCRSHPGFRWLCGGVAVTDSQLIEFRMQAPNASDELLAECLAGLKSSGVLGPRLTVGMPPSPSEAQLLASLDEMREWVRVLRRQLDAPLSAGLQRRLSVAAARRDERKKRVGSALEILKRVIDAQNSQQHREDERQLQAAKAKVTKPLVLVVRPVIGPEPVLPWSIAGEDDQRFRRVLLGALAFQVVVSAVLMLVTLPPVERAEAEKIPPRLAKLVLEKKELPKPEPVKIEEVRTKELTPEKTEAKAEERPASSAQPEQRREAAAKPSSQQVADARERASRTGLVAMRDQLAALRALSSESSLRQQQFSVGVEGTAQRAERDLIGAVATGSSGGVAGGAVAYGGGGSLAAHKTTQVRGPSGAPSLAEITKEAKSGKRSSEDIKLGFDANKAALYALYRRALRENPTLEGRVVFKLSVDASGQVTACSIISSALKDTALEEKLVARVQLINFGPRPGVDVWSNTFHVDFIPAS